MKKNTIILAIFTAVFAGGILFSQETDELDEISLPDVSTVISGGAPKVGKSAISDFSDVLPSADSEIEDFIPRLPETSETGTLNSDAVLKTSPEKSIYVEGLAGGGFPGFIAGNFKIYRETGLNPFVVEFGHESANGYSGRNLSSAYSDRNTFISADKVFKTENLKIDINGRFEATDNGLQNKFENISNVTKENLGAGFSLEKEIPHGMELVFSALGDWYKRYSTITGTPAIKIEDYAKNVGLLYFDPEFYFLWQNAGFSLKTTAAYGLEYDTKDSFEGSRASNRGDFSVDFGWKNETVDVFSSVGLVAGNHIGDNSVVVPFEAGVDFAFASGISSRKIKLGVKGGLDSFRSKVSDSEKNYLFAAAQSLPEETSDWFGRTLMVLPIKDRFTLTAQSEFRKSALGNGVFMPDYKTKKELAELFGQYVFVQEELTQFNTDFDFSVRLGKLNLSADWKSYWADVPSGKSNHFVSANISFQDEKTRFGIDGRVGMSLDSDYDSTPEIDFEAFFRLTPAVRLAVSADDVVKLITTNERDFAGTEYISRSGTASVLVKFFF